MKLAELKIKEKILLLIIFLVSLVSVLIIIVNYTLMNASRKMIMGDISEKITDIQKVSEYEFSTFKNVANDKITEASGVTAIRNIASIALEHQKEFYNMVQDGIGKVGATVGGTLDSQQQTIDRGLGQFSADSVDLINEMINFDNQSLSVLSNVAIFNMDSLKEASGESLEMFSRNINKLEFMIGKMQEANRHEIDVILSDTIVRSNTLTGPQLMEYLVQRFDGFKVSSDTRGRLLYKSISQDYDLQAKVISEEMKIVTDKVNLAISNERNNSKIIQKQKMAEIISRLQEDALTLQNEIQKSRDAVRQSLGQLRITLPLQLQEKGESTNTIIEKQMQEAEMTATGAKNKISDIIDKSNDTALQRMNITLDESEKVIGSTFADSSKKTLLFSILITVVCVLIAVSLGVLLIRDITEPISRVLQFAGKISQGHSAERLSEGSDEMGEMARALNLMADELKKLEEATLNSFNQTLDQVIDCVFMFDPDTLSYQYVNKGAIDQTGYQREELLSLTPLDIKPEFSSESFRGIITPLKLGIKDSLVFTTVHKGKDNSTVPVEILLKYIVPPNGKGRFVEIVRDLSELQKAEKEKERLQSQLLHAQKLESVGQLAAGIAHEINTPMQFVSTNMEFFEEASKGMAIISQSIRDVMASSTPEITAQLQAALDEADWDFLMEEVPAAIAQSKTGINRVTSIVKAMKEFSHPSSREKVKVVVNSIIETTILVARNEWKYVSEVTTDLAPDLPPIPCLVDELGQVLLNLLVNAAQTIGEKLGSHPSGEKGEIHISTKAVDSFVEIRIRDTGMGIPDGIRARIFDPFFTTKEVGRGTGQGLAISHDVITEKHGGTLSFETAEGVGTTFIIRLPLGS